MKYPEQFKIINENFVRRLSDGAEISVEIGLYKSWLAEGNSPLPPDSTSVMEQLKTLEPILREFLDTTCVQYGYDNFQSALNWSGFPNQWQDQATTISGWIASCWNTHDKIVEEAGASQVVPIKIEYLSRLPILKL